VPVEVKPNKVKLIVKPIGKTNPESEQTENDKN